jgi:hypothetical protein
VGGEVSNIEAARQNYLEGTTNGASGNECHLSSRAYSHVIKRQFIYLGKHKVLINDQEPVLGYVTFCCDYGVTVIISTRKRHE